MTPEELQDIGVLARIRPTEHSTQLAEVMFHHFPEELLERIGFDEQDGMVEIVSRLIEAGKRPHH